MINHLYTNGCSWTAGNGIDQDPLLKIIPYPQKYNYLNKLGWPAKLAQHLNVPFTNEAQGAGSNKRMIRTTCDFLRKYPKEEYKNLVIVLGWTTVDRNEMYFEENENTKGWCMFNASQPVSSHGVLFRPDFTSSFLHRIDDWQKQYVGDFFSVYSNYSYYFQEMYLMSNMLENLNIKYMFFSSLPWKRMIYGGTEEVLKSFTTEINELKKPTILQTRDCDDSLNVMSDFCLKNNLPMANDHHTMSVGHAEWANHLLNELKELYPNDI
jgi:hypothetical protein